MPGVDLLVSDILSVIMLHLPSRIDQKFAVAQVSRFWRGVALSSPLFWSSFSGGASKMDLYCLSIVLERSGPNTMLHVELDLPRRKGAMAILKKLVPFAARIETLDISNIFEDEDSSEDSSSESSSSEDSSSEEDSEEGSAQEEDFGEEDSEEARSLLTSGLEFPALQSLRLAGSADNAPLFALKAPRLRDLDIEGISPVEWSTLLVPTLEHIRVYDSRDTNVEILSTIFEQCPEVWRIVLCAYNAASVTSEHSDEYFEVFARRPLAPTLRALDLQLPADDLVRVLQTGFSGVLLPSLSGCIYIEDGEDNIDTLDTLTGALLPGVGLLVSIDLLNSRHIALWDEDGNSRDLELNWLQDVTDSAFEGPVVWEYLSRHYNLHKSVQDIQISFCSPGTWEKYVEAFDLYSPLQDGIILGVKVVYTSYSVKASLDDLQKPLKMMRLPGLAKIELLPQDYDDYLSVESIRRVLARIEPPTARKVEVCVGNKVLRAGGSKEGAFSALKALLDDDWVLCSHCVY
ncbi:hypothetical protein C8F04DRAFT_353858 [Mycena alexandri]|uniref:F-box domain-containing protein n=1 Tax=Mycena alexandri TaxID=1745969 RepID=A0AAD6XAX6_9AGAR|nr:hypothetical protein C8F04DRAFT_353858 [Mycena alexandri]